MTTPLTCESLRLRQARLAWLRESARKERDEHILALRLADQRQQLAPKIQAHLESIQGKTHAQTVGAYEAILTELVHEVLGPGRDVKLTTGFRNNQPALDIDVLQGEFTEDVLDGNGGALTNVVCAGLRFAVIARSGTRRFIVLDEPDCWLKPARVPAFFKALASVCEQAGFQALVVSHHPLDPRDPNCIEGAEVLPDSVSYARLYMGADGKVAADCELSGDVTDGIASLHAVDFRTHLDTTVRLGPGLTLLTGDNNLGKSAIIAGLRAVARGGASDAHIRHTTDSLKFAIALIKEGQRHRLVLQRKRKGSPRVTLTHYIDGVDGAVHEERGSQHSVPDWLSSLLNLDTIEGLDPQLLGQKTPVFLLDQPASVRAKLLYAGREAAILAKMFALHRKQVAEDRDLVAKLNALIGAKTLQLDATNDLDTLDSRLTVLSGKAEELKVSDLKQKTLAAVLPKLTRATAQAELSAPALSVAVPELHDCVGLQRKAKQISRTKAVVESHVEVTLPVAPTLKDSRSLHKAGVQISRLSAVANLPLLPPPPAAPELHPTVALAQRFQRLAKAVQAVAALEAEEQKLLRETEVEHTLLEALIAEIGGACPLCNSTLTKESLGHAPVF